jgi:hypothetical protein
MENLNALSKQELIEKIAVLENQIKNSLMENLTLTNFLTATATDAIITIKRLKTDGDPTIYELFKKKHSDLF